jgi:hypothetical protein
VQGTGRQITLDCHDGDGTASVAVPARNAGEDLLLQQIKEARRRPAVPVDTNA